MWNLTGNQAPEERQETRGATISHLPSASNSLFHSLWGLGYDEGELGWLDRALCAETDPDIFFPEKGGSTAPATSVCQNCEVRGECLEYALANDIRHGIWGGMSDNDRRRASRQRRRAAGER